MSAEAAALKTVYTCAEFAAEILAGNHSAAWVRAKCNTGEIKTVGRRPHLIPRSEAERFINPK